MLRQRFLTAAILVPLIVWALLSLNTLYITLLLALVAVLAAWEWLSMMKIEQPSYKAILILGILVLGWLSMRYVSAQFIIAINAVLWSFATLFIVKFANHPLPERMEMALRNKYVGLVLMGLILIPFVGAGSALHAQSDKGPLLLLYVLVTVWLADTGGYFIGKQYGKHKLAKAISPNKTWQGAMGALIFGLVCGLVMFYLMQPTVSLWLWLLLNSFIVSVSIIGDLFESLFKRCFAIKDSGQLLPGHGGLLDRIDSQLSAIPLFLAILMALGINPT